MKHYIISGSSRGIGFEIVKQLLNNGDKVIAISRNTNQLNALNHEGLKVVEMDLSEKQPFKTLNSLVETFFNSTIDVVLYNAAVLKATPFEETTLSDWKFTYNTNVFGAVQILQFAKPFLVNGSKVWFVSSMGGIQGSQKFPGLSAYSSSKAALINIAECLAEEWKNDGVSVNTFALGAVNTEMLNEAFPGYQAQVEANEMAEFMIENMNFSNKFMNGKTIQVSSTTP
ncbi:MAG: SDR family NAD(P)-dependent oxidoreductase [Flavobacteriales bacterium]